MQKDIMIALGGTMKGPIDYLIVGFDNAKFDGAILQALSEAIDKGVIRLIALSVISKDQDGTVTYLGVSDIDDEVVVDFAQKYNVSSSTISTEDEEEVAELLNENEAAGLLIIEQLWAKPLKKALLDKNAYLIAEGRIHPDAAAELEGEE